MSTDRVPTDLETQGKPGKIKWSRKSGNFFCFSKKSGKVRKPFLNATYHEIKKCCDFHLKYARLSFQTPVKLLAKYQKWSGKFVSRSGKRLRKTRELFFRFWVGTLTESFHWTPYPLHDIRTGFPVKPGNLEFYLSRSRNGLEFIPKSEKNLDKTRNLAET